MTRWLYERRRRGLTPEEDAVEDPDEDDGIDDLLPADLWFLAAAAGRRRQSAD